MSQCKCFGVFFVQPERTRDCTRYLRNLDRVSQTVSEMIAKAGGENLSFALQASEGPRVDDAVPVALEIGSVDVRWLRESAATQTLWTKREVAQHSLVKRQLFRQLS